MTVARIVSGGQSGVDRAALEIALELGLATGGWCPRGREAEDGTIDTRYPLRETASPDPAWRTFLNVRDSSATLILHHGAIFGGTAATVRAARALGRPFRTAALPADAAPVAIWLRTVAPATLNIAGPRESEAPGIQILARNYLRLLLSTSGTTRRRS